MNLDRQQAPHPSDVIPAAPAALEVTSADFTEGQPLPESAGVGAGNTSPQLSWAGAPDGTRSFQVLCHDPDAPVIGGFTHWALINIPAAVTSMGSGEGADPLAGVSLTNDFGTRDFGGAAPPEGDRPHRYVFTVVALDVDPGDTGLDETASFAAAQFMTMGNVLARGHLTGTYAL